MRSSPKRTLLRLLLLSTAFAGGTALVQAQTTQLDTLVVDGGGNGSGGEAQLRTSTGSKVAVAVKRIPQSVSTVTRDQLDKNPSTKADEALRYSAGVNTQTYGADADTDWYSIRGFQAEQTGMFLDNMQLYQTGFGTFVVDPYLLERIDVLKGPVSSLYGGANVGGIVNYTGKRPRNERFLETETGVNNFGNAYLGVDGGDVIADGDLAYRLTAKLSGGGWETDKARDLRGVVQGSVTWTPTDATSVTVYGNYQNVDLDHTSTGFMPYLGTAVDAPGGVRIPRNLNYGESAIDVYQRQQFMIGYELEHDINDSWTVRQNARYAGMDLNEDYIYASGFADLAGTQLVRDRWAHHTKAGIGTIDTQVEGNFATGPVDHTLLLGVDFKSYRHEPATFYAGNVGNLDIYNPVYGIPYTAPALAAGQVTTMNQLGFYAQDQLRLDNFVLTLNGRYDLARTELIGPTPSTREEGVFTGRVGLGYEFDNGLTPYVSYATSFNPSLATTTADALLPSETGEQWEAGIKYEPTFMDGLITASVFNINRNGVAAPDPVTWWKSVPVGKVNVQGAELEGMFKIEDFTVRGALTYLDAEVVASTNAALLGKTPVQVPTLTASFGVDYTFTDGTFDGLTIGAGVRVLGETWADQANTTKVPGTALIDAGLSYKRDDWSAALNVSNILDTSYVASCQTTTSCGYGQGRTATLSFKKSW
ncbi:TonB-dependent siderophore receptor [Devosia sp.]|uniref:TonB-dependent siderophore receptor n=1 Tax=Devosia sp. TaxID=1871048 RepID=UPI001AC3D7AA|nr:TonB-dependent siderophore receptor [Devosia sp.]MBN9334315.1 TonB-dependent siderophore receptor [Devosia sp.]